jgi:hypothetical protein
MSALCCFAVSWLSLNLAHEGRRNQRDHDGEEPESCVIFHNLIYLFKRGLWSGLCQTLAVIYIFISWE